MDLQDFACACSDLIHGGELRWDRPDGLNILYQQIKKRVKSSPLHFEEIDKCNCEDFNKGIEQLNNCIKFSTIQSAGPKYNMPVFKYCPWCGKKIMYNKEV